MGICKICGKPIADGTSLCAACEETAMPTMAPLATVAPVTEDPESKPASLGSFFGLIALFGLPVVGIISAIIFSFAPKNKSIKNFSRAALIWLIIGSMVLGLLVGLVVTAVNLVIGAVGDMVGKDLKDIGDLVAYAGTVYQEVDGTLQELEEIGLTTDKIVAYADLLQDVREANVNTEEFIDVWTQYKNGELSNANLVKYGDLLEDAEEAGLSPDQMQTFADKVGSDVDLGALAKQYGNLIP